MTLSRPTILLHVDGGACVGFGHVARGLGLAPALEAHGYEPVFAISEESWLRPRLSAVGWRVELCPPASADLLELYRRQAAVAMVIDSYRLDADALVQLRQASVPIIRFDDTGDCDLPADLVITLSSAPRSASRTSEAWRLEGVAFQIVRPGFGSDSPRDYHRRPQRLLVTVGATEATGVMEELLSFVTTVVLPRHPQLAVDAVVGPFSHATPAADGRLSIHHSPDDMAALMRTADVALSAGGQTLFELACCGLPTVAFCLTWDQVVNLQVMAQHGAIDYVGWATSAGSWLEGIGSALHAMLTDATRRAQIGRTAAALIDGRGAARIAQEIDALVRQKRPAVSMATEVRQESAATRRTVTIGTKRIGAEEPCFLIAEIGSNHNGSLHCAKELIQAAAEAGMDAVKFQSIKFDELYVPQLESAERQAFMKRIELPESWYPQLAQCAADCGVVFLSSPTYLRAVGLLEAVGVPAYKIASPQAAANPALVREVARRGKPVILSTGCCTAGQIAEMIQRCYAEGSHQLVLLHCVSEYPTVPEHANLRSIDTLKRMFDVPVGFSDHTLGFHLTLAAVALGACVIEKHVTLDRTSDGPDHAFAIEPAELRDMVRAIRNVERSLGDGSRARISLVEQEMLALVRTRLVARVDIPQGRPIQEEDLAYRRAPHGIYLEELSRATQAVAAQTIPAWTPLTWDKLTFHSS